MPKTKSKRTLRMMENLVQKVCDDGYTLNQVAEENGVTNETVYKHLDEVAEAAGMTREDLVNKSRANNATQNSMKLQPKDRFKEYWTKEMHLIAIKRLAEILGRTPTSQDYDDCPWTPSHITVRKYFGIAWNDFVREAGLEVNTYKPWTDEDLFSGVRQLAKELGKVPTRREYERCEYTAHSGIIRMRFGSWNTFLEKAGLKPRDGQSCPKTGWTMMRSISAGRKLYDELGRLPTTKEFNECEYTPDIEYVNEIFGSWGEYCSTAGLMYRNSDSKTRYRKRTGQA